MAHTPGPWVASPDPSSPAIPYMIGAPVSDYLPASAKRHIGGAYVEANARLMAAAPELLDACQALLADAEGYARTCKSASTRAAIRKRCDTARAAIEKGSTQ